LSHVVLTWSLLLPPSQGAQGPETRLTFRRAGKFYFSREPETALGIVNAEVGTLAALDGGLFDFDTFEAELRFARAE
jgi:hypothetical protein